MVQNLKRLTQTLDDWADQQWIAITETNDVLVAKQLRGDQAVALVHLLNEARCDTHAYEFADDGGQLETSEISDAYEGLSMTLRKPPSPADVETILTLTAFSASLERPIEASRIWLLPLVAPFETLAVRYGCWGDEEEFHPTIASPDPRKVVRPIGAVPKLPDDLDRWRLTTDGAFSRPSDRAFTIWQAKATVRLAACLSNEIEQSGLLLFRGPPTTRFRPTTSSNVAREPFEDLQRAIAWVYESDRELENRHALLAAEIARASVRDGDLTDLCLVAGASIEGARIAYNFGVTQQSRDTLKALSDLRKAVSDETTKLADTTRTLAAAIASAVFGNIGLIVARLTLPPSSFYVPLAAVVLGIVLALYVATVIWSGTHFLRLQRDLRSAWRSKLYRFLTDLEYKEMVDRPAARAERGFRTAAWCGGVLCALMLLAVILIALKSPGVDQLPKPQPISHWRS